MVTKQPSLGKKQNQELQLSICLLLFLLFEQQKQKQWLNPYTYSVFAESRTSFLNSTQNSGEHYLGTQKSYNNHNNHNQNKTEQNPQNDN